MDKKYELTDEFVEVAGIKLYRIKALKDFGHVKKGDLGGYLESEKNLSHHGNCWVGGKAYVYGEAQVYSDAQVSGDATVWGFAQIGGYAKVCGHSRIYEFASIYGSAEICGNVAILGSATVTGNIRLCGDAILNCNAILIDKDHENLGIIEDKNNGTCTYINKTQGLKAKTATIDEFNADGVHKNDLNNTHRFVDTRKYVLLPRSSMKTWTDFITLFDAFRKEISE